MARLLIVGADGMLGAAAMARLAAEGHVVSGTTRRRAATGGDRVVLDLEDPALADSALPACDVAIICAAMARFADCRAFPERARRINVTAPAALAARLAATGARIILLSTSAVFDGTIPHRPAEATPTPRSAYGRLKAEAEAAILALGPAASVLRLTKVFSPATPLLAGWVERLRAGRPVRAFSDLTIAPIGVEDVTQALVAIVGDGAGGGVYQASGAADVSYFDFARLFAAALGVDPGLAEAGGAIASGIPADEVQPFTSLDCSRLAGLSGFVAPRPEEFVARLLK